MCVLSRSFWKNHHLQVRPLDQQVRDWREGRRGLYGAFPGRASMRSDSRLKPHRRCTEPSEHDVHLQRGSSAGSDGIVAQSQKSPSLLRQVASLVVEGMPSP
jgi:hypothetical protein